MNIGETVPLVQFKATNGCNMSFDQYRGKWLIIYFYPKDATPGCTTEGCDFRDYDKDFAMLNANIVGISRDGLSSHQSFKSKHHFPFELISDSNEVLCELFDVIKMKSMYGKQVRGIERSTFVIDPDGKLIQAWRGVKVEGHVKEVLQFIKQHNSI